MHLFIDRIVRQQVLFIYLFLIGIYFFLSIAICNYNVFIEISDYFSESARSHGFHGFHGFRGFRVIRYFCEQIGASLYYSQKYSPLIDALNTDQCRLISDYRLYPNFARFGLTKTPKTDKLFDPLLHFDMLLCQVSFSGCEYPYSFRIRSDV